MCYTQKKNLSRNVLFEQSTTMVYSDWFEYKNKKQNRLILSILVC